MKKVMTVFVATFIVALFVTSCGPSFCDCVENGMSQNPDMDMNEKCDEKFGDLSDVEFFEKMEGCE